MSLSWTFRLSYTILTTSVQSQMASVSNWREKSSFFSDWHDKNSGNKRWILWDIQIEMRKLKNFILIITEVHLWVSVMVNGILLLKSFWPNVRKNCPSDREKVLKIEAEGQDFAKFLRSLEQFIQTVKGQNNFW